MGKKACLKIDLTYDNLHHDDADVDHGEARGMNDRERGSNGIHQRDATINNRKGSNTPARATKANQLNERRRCGPEKNGSKQPESREAEGAVAAQQHDVAVATISDHNDVNSTSTTRTQKLDMEAIGSPTFNHLHDHKQPSNNNRRKNKKNENGKHSSLNSDFKRSAHDGIAKSNNTNGKGKKQPPNQIKPPNTLATATSTSTSTATSAISVAKTIDISHPNRRPFFSTHMNDGLLIDVASYLNFKEVMTLAMVNKYLEEGLSMEGLYCNSARCHDKGNGLGMEENPNYYHSHSNHHNHHHHGDRNGALLPCLYPLADRLLTLEPISQQQSSKPTRPRGLARTFAYESMTFSQSCELFYFKDIENASSQRGNNRSTATTTTATNSNTANQPQSSIMSPTTTMEPRKIMGTTTPEQIIETSFRLVTWEHAYSIKSGIRLSYVTNDDDNSSLVTMWSNSEYQSSAKQSQATSATSKSSSQTTSTSLNKSTSYYSKERYVPPNTHSILKAAFHSQLGLCAVLATSLVEDKQQNNASYSSLSTSSSPSSSSSGYILSVIRLPTQPFSRNNAASMKHQLQQSQQSKVQQSQPHQHSLQWKKHVSKNWKLFSCSSTHAIVSFSPPGKYVIFGSTEQWGILDAETGARLWSLFSSPSLGGSTIASGGIDASLAIEKKSLPSLTTAIDAYLIHHEFLFVLQNKGKELRIYDDLDLSCPSEPLAEGDLPWSIVKPQEYTRYHPGYHHHNQQTQQSHSAFQLAFCNGRIWITGDYKTDLLCSSPSRLLRRLRSRNNDTPLLLRFIRMKSNLSTHTHHTMISWNDNHLYVIDSAKLYCWNSHQANLNSRIRGDAGMTTVYSGGNKRIEHVHVDGTKLIICTISPFWNTRKRTWEGNERLWVIPIDAFGSSGDAEQGMGQGRLGVREGGDLSFKQLLQKQCQINEQPSQLFPQLEIYHRQLFPSSQPPASNNSINDFLTQNANSFGDSNYHVMNIVSDGRYILVRCEKSVEDGSEGNTSTKVVVIDLYKNP